MITQIYITRYRCFTNFRLSNLTSNTLLVGRNNVGKTSLLLALQQQDSACVFVPSPDATNDQNSMLWEHLAMTDQANQLISALQIIEPNLSNLSYKSDGEPIGLIGNKRISFWSLGHGVNRILTIWLRLLTSSSQPLLIDGVEDGLHYTIQVKFITELIRVAQERQVQLFLTTHSQDFVASFGEAISQLPSDTAELIRLNRYGDEIQAMRYTQEELVSTLDCEVDPR